MECAALCPILYVLISSLFIWSITLIFTIFILLVSVIGSHISIGFFICWTDNYSGPKTSEVSRVLLPAPVWPRTTTRSFPLICYSALNTLSRQFLMVLMLSSYSLINLISKLTPSQIFSRSTISSLVSSMVLVVSALSLLFSFLASRNSLSNRRRSTFSCLKSWAISLSLTSLRARPTAAVPGPVDNSETCLTSPAISS